MSANHWIRYSKATPTRVIHSFQNGNSELPIINFRTVGLRLIVASYVAERQVIPGQQSYSSTSHRSCRQSSISDQSPLSRLRLRWGYQSKLSELPVQHKHQSFILQLTIIAIIKAHAFKPHTRKNRKRQPGIRSYLGHRVHSNKVQ